MITSVVTLDISLTDEDRHHSAASVLFMLMLLITRVVFRLFPTRTKIVVSFKLYEQFRDICLWVQLNAVLMLFQRPLQICFAIGYNEC